MELPIPANFAHNWSKRPVDVAAQLPPRPKSAAKCLAELAQSADKKVLAYLWLAVELGCSIMVFGKDASDAELVIDAISAFVPPYKSVIDLRAGKEIDERINFMGVIRTKNMFPSRPVGFAGKYLPDYLIVPKDQRGELNDLFALAKQGVSFIAPVIGDFAGRPIVKALKSNPFKVSEGNLHMLDISAFIEKNQDVPYIKAITEYKWLCRAETVKYGERQLKKYSNMRVACDGRAKVDIIARSKVVEKYKRLSLLSSDEMVEELGKRADFLGSLDSTIASCGAKNAVCMYYEIK